MVRYNNRIGHVIQMCRISYAMRSSRARLNVFKDPTFLKKPPLTKCTRKEQSDLPSHNYYNKYLNTNVFNRYLTFCVRFTPH